MQRWTAEASPRRRHDRPGDEERRGAGDKRGQRRLARERPFPAQRDDDQPAREHRQGQLHAERERLDPRERRGRFRARRGRRRKRENLGAHAHGPLPGRMTRLPPRASSAVTAPALCRIAPMRWR